MRKSNRTKVLEAATRLVEREGVSSVTYESIAAESGLTKGGLLYHFPSREELLRAIHQHLADEWESDLELQAGKAAAEATPEERLAAYVKLPTDAASRAKLLFLLEGSTSPEQFRPWDAVLERWTPGPDEILTDDKALVLFIARLASDGLWLYESLADSPGDEGLRQRVTDFLARMPAATDPMAPD